MMAKSKEQKRYTISGLRQVHQTLLYALGEEKEIKTEIIEMVDMILGLDAMILRFCAIYSGKKVFNVQKEILNAFQSNPNGIRKYHILCSENRIPEATELFWDVARVCDWICMNGSDKIRKSRLELLQNYHQVISWNFYYLNGTFENPRDVNKITMNSNYEQVLYYSSKKKWAEQVSDSFMELLLSEKDKKWLYQLALDDVFLFEQPKILLHKLIKINIFDKITADKNLAERERLQLFFEYAVRNYILFICKRKSAYKGKTPFENYYKDYITYYSLLIPYLLDYLNERKELKGEKWARHYWFLFKKEDFMYAKRCNLYWFLFSNNALLKKENEDAYQLFQKELTKQNEEQLQELVRLAKGMKKYGFKEVYLRITEMLLEAYYTQQEERQIEDKIRNAVILMGIAPNRGKDAKKKELIRFVEKNADFAILESFIRNMEIDLSIVLKTAEIVFRVFLSEISDVYEDFEKIKITLIQQMSEDPELERKIFWAERVIEQIEERRKDSSYKLPNQLLEMSELLSKEIFSLDEELPF